MHLYSRQICILCFFTVDIISASSSFPKGFHACMLNSEATYQSNRLTRYLRVFSRTLTLSISPPFRCSVRSFFTSSITGSSICSNLRAQCKYAYAVCKQQHCCLQLWMCISRHRQSQSESSKYCYMLRAQGCIAWKQVQVGKSSRTAHSRASVLD